MKHSVRIVLFSTLSVTLASAAQGQFSAAPAPLSATTVPAAQLIQANDLPPLLAQNDSAKVPFVIQVGSRVFFEQAHIRGSVYAGPTSQPAGLALLEKAVSGLAKERFIILYCGCCPWNRCPNVGPAFKHLHDLGYTNVKVLYMANNFGDDWVAKGYPTEK